MTQLTFRNDVPFAVESHNPTAPYAKPPRHILTIKELPEGERPVNRLHHYGANALSTTELLAILLGNPHQLQDASALLAAFENLVGVAQAPVAELQRQPGVGTTTAARLAHNIGSRHKEADQTGRHFNQDLHRHGRELTETAGILLGDGPPGQFGFYVPGEQTDHLPEGQVGVPDARVDIALANRDDQVSVPFLGPSRELGDQGGLATAGLAGHKADLPLAAQGPIEELPQLCQFLFTPYKNLIGRDCSSECVKHCETTRAGI